MDILTIDNPSQVTPIEIQASLNQERIEETSTALTDLVEVEAAKRKEKMEDLIRNTLLSRNSMSSHSELQAVGPIELII
jgi:hypothetical protein